MKNIFNTVRLEKPKKNVFDLSHDVKLSCKMGELIPTLAMECVPGDKVTLGCDSILRFAPLLAPVMHRIDVYMHYFFVPNRILWAGWDKYITNTDPTGFPHPYITMNGSTRGLLESYLGIPDPAQAAVVTPVNISAFPHAAYQMVWREYYRDQNLMVDPWEANGMEFILIDGDNTAGAGGELRILRTRCWEHDYFTAALPFAQKGAAVDIPIGGFDDVRVSINSATPVGDTGEAVFNVDSLPSTSPEPVGVNFDDTASANIASGDLYANTSDLTAATATTINDLRLAYTLQKWLEKAARAGSRLTETIRSHFGVVSSDARLQRPEYITGTKSPVVISEVLNTSGTVTEPQGNMAGHGVGITNGGYGSYFCEEHGYIMGIMSVLPKTAYQNGMPKHFLKINDPMEYFWPMFAHLGEQEIKLKEVFAYTPTQEDIFGYIPRYSEYKYLQNRVAGEFETSLAYWHLGRIFAEASLPALNEVFVESAPRTDIFAVAASEQLYCQILHKIKAVRPMPKFGTPSW